MTDSFWKTGAPSPRRQDLLWPSLTQALRQLGIVAVMAVVWGVLLLGYLGLTGGQPAEVMGGDSESTLAVVSPTDTPVVALPSPTPSPTPIPPTPTLVATAEPTIQETSVPGAEPSPRPTHTPVPSPTPTPSPVLPTPTQTPAPVPEALETPQVSFAADVLPVLQRRCVNCHGGEKTEEGLVLSAYPDVMTGSWNGPVIKPGNAEESYLVEMVASGKMPKKGPRLLPSEIQAIRDWIDAGALDN